MAEPWTDDLAALRDHSREQLRSMAATRASVLASSPPKKGFAMRLFHSHPVFATLLALVLLGATAGGAYAFVEHVFISVDDSKSAEEIEHDVKSQLEQQHVEGDVHVEKSNGHTSVLVQSSDPRLDQNLGVDTPGGSAGPRRAYSFDVELPGELIGTLTTAMQSAAFTDAMVKSDTLTPAQFAATVADALHANGLPNVHVTVSGDTITISP